jgi:hypothetical protein
MSGGAGSWPDETAWQARVRAAMRARGRTWPLEIQARLIWRNVFSGDQDPPSLEDVTSVLRSMDVDWPRR